MRNHVQRYLVSGAVALVILAAPAVSRAAHDLGKCDALQASLTPLPSQMLAKFSKAVKRVPPHKLYVPKNKLGANWGVGLLSMSGFNKLQIPLFAGPNGAQWGWIVANRLVDMSGEKPRVSTYKGGPVSIVDAEGGSIKVALIVLKTTKDDWVEFRWGGRKGRGGGTAWTQLCLLHGKGFAVKFDRYPALFRGEQSVRFRNHAVTRNVRAGPGKTFDVVHLMDKGFNYDLKVVQIAGDWALVRVLYPPSYRCGMAGLGITPKVYEGWIKWRSPEQGPWLWFGAPGC